MAPRRRLDFAGVAEPVRIGETAQTILHKTIDDGVGDLDMAKEIRLDLIDPDPDQPRKHFDEAALRELAHSIRVQGVLQPIVVEWVPERERFRIISGERRWRAARLVAEASADAPAADVSAMPRRDPRRIPAIVKNPGAVDRYIQQVYENEQRQDYSDVERAFAYERLKETLGLTWEDLATKLGLSKGRIHQIRRTKNRLAPSVQRDITSGQLTGRHGLYLAPLPELVQEKVAAAVKDFHLTHQQTQVLVQRVRAAIEGPPPVEPRPATPVEPPPTLTADRRATDAAMTELPTSAADLVAPATTLPETRSRADEMTDAVDKAVTEVNVPRGEVVRSPRVDVDRALALIRQLVRLEVAFPEDVGDRAKLATALVNLDLWSQALRAKLAARTV